MSSEPRAPLELGEVSPLVPPVALAAELEAVGAAVPDATLATLGDYLARLLAMNTRMNLTAVREPDAAWSRHIFDSLTLLPELARFDAGAKLVDVGSGGGLPAIPLAIARPDLRVTMVESTKKKAAFLERVGRSLGLENVAVRAERAEALHRERAGAFDVATARAVSRLSVLVPLVAPLVRRGGRMLFIKGQRAEDELADAEKQLKRAKVRHVATTPTPTGRVVVLARL